MSYFPSSSSAHIFQDFQFYSRRLLLKIPLCQSPTTATPPATGTKHDISPFDSDDHSFDANVVMVTLLICAIICSIGLYSILRCALRCTRAVPSETGNNPSAPLAKTAGINKKALEAFPKVTYSDGLDQPGLDTECVICLSEFTDGECLRVLPQCNHGFHVRCIDKWLSSNSSCPTCRHCLIETCQKMMECTQASPPQPPPQPLQETIVTITPLEAEGLIHNYRNDQDFNIRMEKMKVPIVV
ncbi:RING-H2 finger protein ATL78-like [Cornus florida]|uniref:RING-H2 finger protein ATL78-like n=1 Tax=Cornus florida TaxID=4283 RepID=UPI0028A01CF6|nr:RING-H2 finger protein ATL78-like [Cornus florida]